MIVAHSCVFSWRVCTKYRQYPRDRVVGIEPMLSLHLGLNHIQSEGLNHNTQPSTLNPQPSTLNPKP